MVKWTSLLSICLVAAMTATGSAQAAAPTGAGGTLYNGRDFGAKGDGTTIDSPAINEAIDAAASAGGGTVCFPAGKYLSHSIRLKSNISLYLNHGATIVAAETPGYDHDPPNEWGDVHRYQDGGHSHWRNSLIWGENLENISILGHGMIDGEGLTGSDPPADSGRGNKILALKWCRNVTVRDVTMYRGGHFCILPTGVDNFTIDNIKIDTNRDGINIDACKNVRIANSHINTPNDDAIVLKSSFGLGEARATENVTITNCTVSGYVLGTLLDGTYDRSQTVAPDRGGVTGRIKFGTESNGGFKNVTISNIVFDHCRGLALETVDGGLLEDIVISNITMREVYGSPLFLRLGARMRGPDGVEVGKLHRVTVSNLNAWDVDPDYSVMIMGIPGHNVKDVLLSNIRIQYRGGAPAEAAERIVPEDEAGYPDPWEFVRGGRAGRSGFGGQGGGGQGGSMPAWGFFIRHAEGITVNDARISTIEPDLRPAFILDDVKDARFNNVRAQKEPDVPTFVLKNVEDFRTQQCDNVPDTRLEKAEDQTL